VFRALAEWLATWRVSEALQSWFWIIPTLQVFHLLALAIVMASVWMLYLRVMGVAGRAHTIETTARRFLPWIWRALVVLAISGSLLIIAEPRDSLLKPMLQIKLVLLVFAVVLTLFFQHGVRKNVYRDASSTISTGTKALGAVSLLIWISIAVAGRLIAYVV
jgi:uncharacterized membrane protein